MIMKFESINIKFGGARGVIVIIVEMDTATQVQILDKVVYISHSAYALSKGTNLTILLWAIDK